jgi:hypothetical protein
LNCIERSQKSKIKSQKFYVPLYGTNGDFITFALTVTTTLLKSVQKNFLSLSTALRPMGSEAASREVFLKIVLFLRKNMAHGSIFNEVLTHIYGHSELLHN